MNSRKNCYEYQICQQLKLEEFMAPLLRVNINWFVYGRFSLDEWNISKTKFRLDTNLGSIKWLCENARDHGNDYTTALRQTKLNQYSYFITPKETSDYIINAFRKKYGLLDGLTIYRRNRNSIESWSFRSTYEYSLLSSNSLDNQTIDFLSKFRGYFNNKLLGMNLQYQIGIDFPDGIDFSPPVSQSMDIFAGIECMQPYRDLIQINDKKFKISKREWECWRLITLGQSVKRIAAKLEKISPRTVESYIETLKQKIGCYERSSLAKLFIENFKEWI